MSEILAAELQYTAIGNLTVLNQKITHDVVLSTLLDVTPVPTRILIQAVDCE